MAVRFDADGDYLSRSADLPAVSPLSWVGSFYISVDRNAGSGLFVLSNAGFTAYDFLSLLTTDGTTLVASTNLNTAGVSGTNLSVGTWYRIGYTRNGATHLVYLNGTLNITLSSNNTVTPTTLLFGAPTNWFNGRVAYIKMWTATLDASEILAESNSFLPVRTSNLYGDWRLPTHTDLTDSSGNGRTLTANGTLTTEAGPPRTMIADAGSYALTGQAATLRASRLMPADQGSYALTGQAANLLRGYPLAAEQGSYTLTGQAANLIAARQMAAAQGSYALTGQGANLLVGRLLQAAQGAYTLTGQDVTLAYTPVGGYTLTAEQGSYVLSGQTVNLFVNRLLEANQGAYTLTGQQAQLLVGRLLQAAQGSYTLTGQAASLLVSRLMAAGLGSYVLSGRPVTLVWSGEEPIVTPASRVYVIPFEGRTYVIVAEDRTYVIAAEDRVHAVH